MAVHNQLGWLMLVCARAGDWEPDLIPTTALHCTAYWDTGTDQWMTDMSYIQQLNSVTETIKSSGGEGVKNIMFGHGVLFTQ